MFFFACRLLKTSASRRSEGPQIQVLSILTKDAVMKDPVLQIMLGEHRRTTASLFNASNHEYYRIPLMANVFDPSLAVRIVPNATSARGKIPTSVVWEQGMTLCLWYRCVRTN